MTDPDRTSPALLAGAVLALDVVDEHVVLLDHRGRIVHANVAWQRFALDNGDETASWVGTDYVAASAAPCLQAGVEDPVTDGVVDVLEGRRRSFEHEYDCHAPDELRWFRLLAVRAELPGIAAIVTHTDITAQRLAERALEHHATHDRVTGLANRAAVEQLLGQMLREGQDPSIITATLADADQHGGLLHDETLRRSAHLLRELFPAPSLVGRWDVRTLVVAQSGQGADALAEAAGVVGDTLGSLHETVECDVVARPLRAIDQVASNRAADRLR